MKNTKLFSALLCGTVILAGCSKFTGTDNTFEKDIQEKYKNSGNNVFIQNHNTLTVNSFSQFAIGDKNSDGDTLNYKAKLKFNASLKESSLSGITMDSFTLPGDEKKPYECISYTGFSASFDSEDVSNSTVVLTVTGDTAPKSFIITVNAATVESVAGQKLDKDNDAVWGEKEDNAFYIASTTYAYERENGIFSPSGYFLTGRETFNFAPSGSVTDDKLIVTADIMNPENKSIVDAAIIIEKYDIATDSWSILNGNESTCSDAGIWEKEYEVKTYVPLRMKVKGLKDLKLKNSIGLEFPLTTNAVQQVQINDYEFASDVITSNYYDGFFDPTKDDLSGSFALTSKGNGVYDIKLGSWVSLSWDPDSSTSCYTTEFTGWTVPENSVKVLIKGSNNKLYEVPAQVSVVDDTILRITLNDKEANINARDQNGIDYDFVVTVTKDVKVSFNGKKDGNDEKFTLSLGHLCEASATYTLNGSSIIAN